MSLAQLAAIKMAKSQSSTSRLQALGRLKTGERNKTEQAFEEHLAAMLHAGEVQWFKFEAIKLRLADSTFLTVDFAVMRADGVLEMIDVKGAKALFTDDARVKMKVAASMFPFVFKVAYPLPKKSGGGWDIEEV